jgi:hypothetical protein
MMNNKSNLVVDLTGDNSENNNGNIYANESRFASQIIPRSNTVDRTLPNYMANNNKLLNNHLIVQKPFIQPQGTFMCSYGNMKFLYKIKYFLLVRLFHFFLTL